METSVPSADPRDRFIEEGSRYIKSELDKQADYVVTLQDSEPLSNLDILSDNLIANKNINQQIKTRVLDCSSNVKKLILATVGNIEAQKYQGVEEKIKSKGFKRLHLDRVMNLFGAQRKLSGSFQTLMVVVDSFKLINEKILGELKNLKTSEKFSEVEYTTLLLKNAILVYELTKFTVDYLECFSLLGLDDVKCVRDQVYADLERGEQSDKKIEQNMHIGSQAIQESTKNEIETRRQIREKVREKWEEIIGAMEGVKKESNKASALINDLKIIRDNAKARIDVIQLVIVSQVVESTIQAVQGLSDISAFKLADFDVDTAVKLLNLSM